MSEVSLSYDNILSAQEYLESTHIDLKLELTSMMIDDVGEGTVECFINGIEKWCKSYLRLRYAFDGSIAEGNQTKRFKQGIINQIQYVLRNGNLSKDSGLIAATGQIIDPKFLDKIGMDRDAMTEFQLGGMANIRRY